VTPELESEPSHAGTNARHPRQRGRHIPAAVRRAVSARDGQQCSYVDPAGRRCPETHLLEFHHLEPFALGGEHTAENVALRCVAHNALAAEDDFGRERIEVVKGSRH
jgi:5-methylcytosine-specific restriction endonuclease McrA